MERLNKRIIFEVAFSRTLTAKEVEKLLIYCEELKKTDKIYRLSGREKTKLTEILKMLSELPVIKIETVTRGLDEIFKYYIGRNNDD